MPADLPIFNGNTRPGEEEQSFDVPIMEAFPLDGALVPLTPVLDLSADLSPDFIDIAALVRDEHLLSEQDENKSHSSLEIVTLARIEQLPDVESLPQLSQSSEENELTTSELSSEVES